MSKNWRVTVIIIWICLASIFGVLAVVHYNFSKKDYPKFAIEVPQGSNRPEFFSGTAIDTARKFEEFFKKFNTYIDDSNKQNRSANCASFWGYLGAFFTALFSAFLESISLWKNK